MNDLIAVQKIAGWEKLKALVLDSVSSESMMFPVQSVNHVPGSDPSK